MTFGIGLMLNQKIMYLSGKILLLSLLLMVVSTGLEGQTTVTGTIIDGGTGQPLEGVNIAILGSIQGTTTNKDGKYTLTVNLLPPFTVAFSYLGFHAEQVEIKENSNLDIIMIEEALFGQEIVISATRLKERILLSPVTIEKMDIKFIQQTASAEFYDAIATMKGVQVTNSSINLTSVNTRGFSDVTNSRFVQLVDGVDTADPTTNANLGSIIGISELDIESLELLPGAASALYGPNAFNGIMLMTSKSPFDYQGLSLMTKVGFTNSQAGGSNPMSIYSLRYAKAFNNKIAFKVNAYYLGAQDWTANDYKTDRNNSSSKIDLSNKPDFDGVNLHGDESPVDLSAFGVGIVRRTGIKEADLLDHNNARTRKVDAAIHYKMKDNVELIGAYRYAGGNSLGQGLTKYAYRNFVQELAKLELKADNFFVRQTINITNIEDTYDVGALGAYVNEYFNPSQRPDGSGWFTDYATAYSGAIPGVSAANHAAARTYADRFMIDPATGKYVASFRDVIDQIRPIDYQGNPPGPSFFAKSYIYNSEVFYNFNKIKWAEIIAGGNYRLFSLFSKGTIFDEAPEAGSEPQRIFTHVYGGYVQIAKTLVEKLKVTGSLRYDKMKDFKGHITPRASAVYSADKNNNIRLSYQTGFRFPDQLQQFIYFPVPGAIALGGSPSIASRYGVYDGGSYTIGSYIDFATKGGTFNPTTGAIITNPGNIRLQTANVPYLKLEELSSFEIGYNGIIGGNLLVDLNYYHTSYTNFIGQEIVVSKTSTTHRGEQIDAGSIWALNANSPAVLTSDGFGLELTYNLPKNFVAKGNYTYATFSG